VEPVKPKKVRASKSIELRCVVKGIPVPEVIWCRENEEIISEDDEFTTSFDSSTGEAILTILKPVEVDRSTYLARAVNIHGKSECMAHISFGKSIRINYDENFTENRWIYISKMAIINVYRKRGIRRSAQICRTIKTKGGKSQRDDGTDVLS